MDPFDPRLAAALAGRYTIERPLGRGGMATVYLARDVKHDRPVALKVLHPELAASLGPERFQREIRLAARLQHPHICGVLDSGEADGQLWFTMPYLEGESLRQRLEREGQLSVDATLTIAREAAEALDYAHAHGVIHRDVKPENILLSGGHALVADFGIAKALRTGSGPGGPDSGLTNTGMAIGTPAYMSPEQASGERAVDARSDVYALGCVAYEMLTGEPPFSGPTMQSVLAKRMATDAPAVSVLRPGIPAPVVAAVAKALSRSAADRFASPGEFAKALGPSTGPEPESAAGTSRGVSPRPVQRAAVIFGVGLLVGLGILFAWRRGRPAGEAPEGGLRRLAVLPFENLGAPEDEYFADGMTDELRGKLATLPSLQVTASRSAAEYKRSPKSLEQIGRELGVDYLLVGKIRWEKSGGQSKVRVSPELIQLTNGDSPTTRWEQPFDATLTDVFQVQGDIAARVAQALDVALGQTEREELTARPTRNLAAYDSYLRGRGTGVLTTNTLAVEGRRAIAYYERAVALDPGFAQAWSELSRVHSGLYYNVASPPDSAAAATAAARALSLDPKLPGAYLALGEFHNYVLSDWPGALQQFAKGRKLAPEDADLLVGTAFAQYSSGHWEEALASLKEAWRLDPRSAPTARRLARTLLWLRRYPEAQEAAEQSLALSPLDPSAIEGRAMVSLAQGDLPGARAALRAPQGLDPTILVSFVAVYWDLFWLLDDDQQSLLLRMPRSQFDNDIGWALAFAEVCDLRGDARRAKAYADTAAVNGEEAVRTNPEDAASKAELGLAYAYAGRPADAIRLAEAATTLVPVKQDSYSAPYYLHLLARVYLRTGHPDKALDVLEQLVRIPYFLSPGWLRIDPEWKPLRGNPRFERLTSGSG